MPTLTLAIDTSCDETAVAVVCGVEVWSNVVASQVELHKPYGGVFPTVAKQAHKEAIWPAVALALKRAQVKPNDITEVVVTVGPGLAPALEVGIAVGVVLATAWGIPLRPANHLEGHLLSVLAQPRKRNSELVSARRQHRQGTSFGVAKISDLTIGNDVGGSVESPNNILGLLISGGHTAFFRVRSTSVPSDKLTQLQPSVKITDSALSLLEFLSPSLAKQLSIDPLDLDFSLLKISPVATDQIVLDRYPNLALTPEQHRPWLHSGQLTIELLGSTKDDAAGEALDKIGRMLNLGYPAGPVMEQFAKQGNPHAFELPLPLTQTQSYDLSFSGLKTHTRNLIDALGGSDQLTKQQIYDLAASVQYAIFRHICYKLNKLLLNEKPENTFGEIWLCGGVAANATLRKMIRQTCKKSRQKSAGAPTDQPQSSRTQSANLQTPTQPIPLKTPYTKKLCGDNAAMVGLLHK